MDAEEVRAKLYAFISDPMNRHDPDLDRARRILSQMSKSQASEAVSPQPRPNTSSPTRNAPTADELAGVDYGTEHDSSANTDRGAGPVMSALDRASGGGMSAALRLDRDTLSKNPIARAVDASPLGPYIGKQGGHVAERNLDAIENYRHAHPVASKYTDMAGLAVGFPRAVGEGAAQAAEPLAAALSGTKLPALRTVVDNALNGHAGATPLTMLAAIKAAQVLGQFVPSGARILAPTAPVVLDALKGNGQ